MLPLPPFLNGNFPYLVHPKRNGSKALKIRALPEIHLLPCSDLEPSSLRPNADLIAVKMPNTLLINDLVSMSEFGTQRVLEEDESRSRKSRE